MGYRHKEPLRLAAPLGILKPLCIFSRICQDSITFKCLNYAQFLTTPLVDVGIAIFFDSLQAPPLARLCDKVVREITAWRDSQ